MPCHPYSERAEPPVFDEPGTCVDTDVEFRQTATHPWNRGIGKTVTAPLGRGFRLTALVDPVEGAAGHMVHDPEIDEWRRDAPDRLALTAVKEWTRPGVACGRA